MMAFILLCLLIQQSLQKEKSKVFFSKEISSEKMIQLFEKLEIELKGKVGLKVHTGEENGKYFLRPDFLADIYIKQTALLLNVIPPIMVVEIRLRNMRKY